MSDVTPTWEFVQNAITSNMGEADKAIRIAYNHMNLIAARYEDIQNDVPFDWSVDVNIGTDVPTAWPNSISTITAPDEPDYSALIPTQVTVPTVTVPGGVRVDAAPTFDVDLTDLPDDLPASTVGSVAALGTLPLIDPVIPTMPVSLLEQDFAFTEVVYAERLAPEVQAQLERVLGGGMGIPQSYWDDLWAEVSNDMARLQAAELRNARNRGAPSYWGLPTEAVLVASRAIQDEGSRKLQQVRLEQAKQQAVFAREDFWQAITKALEYENQWLTFHNAVQARALTAAEQMVGLSVQVYNANVVRFNAMLEAAKLDGSIDDLNVQRMLKKHASELAANGVEIEHDKQKVARYVGEYQGYQANTGAQIQSMGERIRWWNGQTEAHSRYEAMKLQKTGIDIQNYSALLSRIEATSRATAAMLGARTGASQFNLANQGAIFETDVKKNAVALDIGRLTQAAQESKAKFSVSQAQWLGEQGNSLLQNMAQLAVGLAQALVTVSDVNLSSGYQASDSSSISASRNAEKVWAVVGAAVCAPILLSMLDNISVLV